MKVYVKLESLAKTDSGKRKVWQTDGRVTYCCSAEPCYFVWEKASKANAYNPYSGYVPVKDCEVVTHAD